MLMLSNVFLLFFSGSNINHTHTHTQMNETNIVCMCVQLWMKETWTKFFISQKRAHSLQLFVSWRCFCFIVFRFLSFIHYDVIVVGLIHLLFCWRYFFVFVLLSTFITTTMFIINTFKVEKINNNNNGKKIAISWWKA